MTKASPSAGERLADQRRQSTCVASMARADTLVRFLCIFEPACEAYETAD